MKKEIRKIENYPVVTLNLYERLALAIIADTACNGVLCDYCPFYSGQCLVGAAKSTLDSYREKLKRFGIKEDSDD